jgi:hypothetical protein
LVAVVVDPEAGLGAELEATVGGEGGYALGGCADCAGLSEGEGNEEEEEGEEHGKWREGIW